MSNYIVLAFANLHKSDIIGDIALNYLADVANKYKLNEYGDVLNMDKYRINSKTLRQKQIWAFKHFALNREAKEEALKRKKESEIVGESTVKGLRKKLNIGSKKVINLLQKSTSDERMHLSPSIENMSIEEALKQFRGTDHRFPTELLPNADLNDVITLEGRQYLMRTLEADEASRIQKRWLLQPPEKRLDSSGPVGWIIAINEPYWQHGSIGVLAKCEQTIIMDHGANDVRSCIIASKNLPITPVNNYTNGDCAVGMLETNLSACPKICLISL